MLDVTYNEAYITELFVFKRLPYDLLIVIVNLSRKGRGQRADGSYVLEAIR
jgi:hypothetical protein